MTIEASGTVRVADRGRRTLSVKRLPASNGACHGPLSLRLSIPVDLGPTWNERLRVAHITAEVSSPEGSRTETAAILDLELRERLRALRQTAIEMARELSTPEG